jgi:hypothetical protein
MLAVIVAISSAAVSSPHVHAYGGHEHPEHQHGPASHQHEHHDAQHEDGHHDDADGTSARIEACDAGEHAISIPGAAAPAARAHVPLAVLVGSIVVPPVTPARFALAPLDVRVHGPPPDTRLPARAPPLTPLA